MDLADLHRKSVAEFGRLVHAVKPDQWHNDTPCTEWDVRVLVNHLVYEDLWSVDLMGGATLEEVGDRYEGDVLGDDPVGAYDKASQAAIDAVAKAGLDGTVNVSWGQIPAREYVEQLFNDHTIHAWDLAKGIRTDDTLPDELVQASYDTMAPQEEQLKASGAFGSKVEAPPGADLQTKLLAVTGRRRDWKGERGG